MVVLTAMKRGISLFCCAAALCCLNSCITSALIGGASALSSVGGASALSSAAGVSVLSEGISSFFKSENMQDKTLKMKGSITRSNGRSSSDSITCTFTSDHEGTVTVGGKECKLTYASTGEKAAKVTLGTDPAMVYELKFTDEAKGTYTYQRTEANGTLSLGSGTFRIIAK